MKNTKNTDFDFRDEAICNWVCHWKCRECAFIDYSGEFLSKCELDDKHSKYINRIKLTTNGMVQ